MEIKFKRDTSFRKQFFVPDSFAHPAKMDAQLLIWIVERYTKEGETILDPMAGSGTMMLACGLGRNVVLVELEDKFCKMMQDNWEIVKLKPQLGCSMGDCQIIQGDARQLEGLLVDKCIFSPPYAESVSVNQGGERESHQEQRAARLKQAGYKPEDYQGGHGRNLQQDWSYGSSPDNIGNLPYGSIDKIVTSPPYSEEPTISKSYLKIRSEIGRDTTKPSQRYRKYSEVDAVVTSPPYENQGQGQGKEYHPERMVGNETGLGRGYSEDAGNIGNLKSASYLEAMLQVYKQCQGVLKDGGLMILVTKNFIRNKQVIRLDTDTIKLCEQAGFTYLERHYRKLPSQSFWRVIYHQKHPEVEQILHEDVLVFRS